MYEGVEEHRFYGTHAIQADQLKDEGFFPRLVDILATAPVVGFEYGRRASKNIQDAVEKSMFLGQLQKVNSQLELNYKTIMLLDKEHEPDEAARFKIAFQVSPENRSAEDLERYESYVRGGIEFLHEKLLGTGNTPSERLMDLHELVESFSDRYAMRDN